MGVPAFFRWLSRKYPSIVVQCDDGVKGDYHFDNLYLDMNGIIHPCSHPENKPPPENEEEMFLAIFEYVEDILKIVRPKKLLYMAVDGVAPRAKMNQQRSRRFRAAQESYEKMIEVQKVKDDLRERGIEVHEKEKGSHFDSNVITPGTQFMINLSDALRTWIHRRLSLDFNDKDGIWPKDMVIILSDASVPGEGEHKIMDYIRRQKADEHYDPNLSHCLYGADADLIMLGLATHEPNFTILREEFKPNQPRPCDLCGQLGHELKECTGEQKPIEDLPVPMKTDFIYIRLNVLREYLQKESTKCSVALDFERFIDDWVFLCFFVGNDFLPHLPSLEIRENAIDRLITIYKFVIESIPPDGDDIYLTKSGIVNKERAQCVLQELGEVEDEIFKQRQRNEQNFKERNKRRKLMRMNEDLKWMNPQAVNRNEKPDVFSNAREEAAKVRATYHNPNDRLNAMMVSKDDPSSSSSQNQKGQQNRGFKRQLMEDSDEEPEDPVQLHTEGWKERYYLHKFDCNSPSEIGRMVANEYFRGLCWVLLYYYQGCPDWKWFFPYHYAPFASDFHEVAKVNIDFDRSAKPFRPLEQLMSVFPAASSKNLPVTWRDLMVNTESSIVDFYPLSFKIDLNGKKAAWMGVALLPFIDEERLFRALENVYNDLTEEEKSRNSLGGHLIFVSKCHPEFTKLFIDIIETNKSDIEIPSKPDTYKLMSGKLQKSQLYSDSYPNILCCEFIDPQYDPDFIFPAQLLKNATMPQPVLKPQDLSQFDNYRPMIGMNRHQNRGYVDPSGHRTIERSVPRDQYRNRNRDIGQGYQNQYGYDHNPNYRQQSNYGNNNNNWYQNQSRDGGRSNYANNNNYYNNRGANHNNNNNNRNYGGGGGRGGGNGGGGGSGYYQSQSNYYQNQQQGTYRPPQYSQQYQGNYSRGYQPPPPQNDQPSGSNIPSYYTNDYVQGQQQQPNNGSSRSSQNKYRQHNYNRY